MDSAILLTFEGLRRLVDPWRRSSSLPESPELTLADLIPPHMTVASPAHPDPCGDEAAALLRESVEGMNPFELRFRTVGTFPHGTVFLEPEPSQELDLLGQRLHARFAQFGGVRADHVWHLTVARTGGELLAARLRSGLWPVDVPVEAVSIWTQDHLSVAWSCGHAIRLGGRSISPQT